LTIRSKVGSRLWGRNRTAGVGNILAPGESRPDFMELATRYSALYERRQKKPQFQNPSVRFVIFKNIAESFFGRLQKNTMLFRSTVDARATIEGTPRRLAKVLQS